MVCKTLAFTANGDKTVAFSPAIVVL